MTRSLIEQKWLPSLVLIAVILVGLLVGCKEDPPATIWSQPYTGGGQPAITSIAPPLVALSGVDTITITGTNFSPTKEDNFVYFDITQGTVLSASPTQLTIKAPVLPILPKDSVRVVIGVTRAPLYSAPTLYKFDKAVSPFGGLKSYEEPFGLACDSAGNVYVSIVSGGTGVGVKKITPAGVKSDYAPKGPETKWSALKVGPGGVIYAARIVNAIYRIPSAGAAPVIWVGPSGIGRIYDFDFDPSYNLWAGGSNTAIYRVKQDKSIKAFNFNGNVRSVRVFQPAGSTVPYVYLGARVDSVEGVWRLPILSADSLGPVERYFAYPTNGPGVYAVTFSADGDMYVGTDGSDGITVVHSNGQSEPLFPGLLQPGSLLFAWGKDTELYVSRVAVSITTAPGLSKIVTKKQGAPYYGRQ